MDAAHGIAIAPVAAAGAAAGVAVAPAALVPMEPAASARSARDAESNAMDATVVVAAEILQLPAEDLRPKCAQLLLENTRLRAQLTEIRQHSKSHRSTGSGSRAVSNPRALQRFSSMR